MFVVTQALIPVFALIILGHCLRRWGFPGEAFWPLAERLTYYVLFPAMLVYRLGSAEIPASAYADVAQLMVAMLLVMAGILVLVQAVTRWPGAVFTSFFQGGFRFNAFVALAAADMLLGSDAVPLFAVAVAIQIPLINLLCILMFSLSVGQQGTGLAGTGRAVATNPLILGSVAGAIWGYLGFGFHPFAAGILAPLSDMTLPLGLLTVGAGLELRALRGASVPFVMASALKLILFPLLTVALASLMGMDGLLVKGAILLAALPAASSSYILARQLGGDAPLMAAIISGETLLAMLTMPLMLSWLW